VDDITTQRWVGKRDSASQAAAEFVRVLARRPWFWGLVAAIEVAYALFLAVALDDRYGPLDRVLWGTVYALVPTAGVVVVVLGLSYLVNRRRFRQRIREGVVLEASVGERSLTLRSPWAEHVLLFDGLAKVVTSGDWIFIKQKAVPIWAVWPVELIPPDDLSRLRLSIAGHKP
jgi:hypothetical protein